MIASIQHKMPTQPINVTAFDGETVVAILEPLEYTETFRPSEFSEDFIDEFPYTPVCLCKTGFEYAHCGCETEAAALDVVREMCFGTDVVFLFLLERKEIKHGWFLRRLEN